MKIKIKSDLVHLILLNPDEALVYITLLTNNFNDMTGSEFAEQIPTLKRTAI